MRKITLWLALVLVGIVCVIPGQSTQAEPAVSPALQSSANDLIAEVNALRISNGLPPYTVNPILMQVAQDQANYMAATGQVAHRPGLTQRILNAGYPLAGDLSQGGFRAENITGSKTAAQAVQGWTGDAPHLNTMLSPNLTEIGAGVAKVGDRYYMVIDCARPTTGGVPQAFTPNSDAVSTESFSPSDFIVPITLSTPDETGMVYHEVQYGQSLWAIAIEYGVKIDEIRGLNNLGPGTEIYQGDKLLVRKDAPPVATIPATVVASPTGLIYLGTATASPTMTTIIPTIAKTPATSPGPQQSSTVAGVAVGIVLAAMLLAGMLTWMSSRKPV
jgi:LysM repeat protein